MNPYQNIPTDSSNGVSNNGDYFRPTDAFHSARSTQHNFFENNNVNEDRYQSNFSSLNNSRRNSASLGDLTHLYNHNHGVPMNSTMTDYNRSPQKNVADSNRNDGVINSIPAKSGDIYEMNRPTEAFYSAQSTPRHSVNDKNLSYSDDFATYIKNRSNNNIGRSSTMNPPQSPAIGANNMNNGMAPHSSETELVSLTQTLKSVLHSNGDGNVATNCDHKFLPVILLDRCEASLRQLSKLKEIENYFRRFYATEEYVFVSVKENFDSTFTVNGNRDKGLLNDVTDCKSMIESIERAEYLFSQCDFYYKENIANNNGDFLSSFNDISSGKGNKHSIEDLRDMLSSQNEFSNDNRNNTSDSLLLLQSKIISSLQINETVIQQKWDRIMENVRNELLLFQDKSAKDTLNSNEVNVVHFEVQENDDNCKKAMFYLTRKSKKLLLDYTAHLSQYITTMKERLDNIIQGKRNRLAALDAEFIQNNGTDRSSTMDVYDPNYAKIVSTKNSILKETENLSNWRQYLEDDLLTRVNIVDEKIKSNIIESRNVRELLFEKLFPSHERSDTDTVDRTDVTKSADTRAEMVLPVSESKNVPETGHPDPVKQKDADDVPNSHTDDTSAGVYYSEGTTVLGESLSNAVPNRKRHREKEEKQNVDERAPKTSRHRSESVDKDVPSLSAVNSRETVDSDDEVFKEEFSLRKGNLFKGVGRLLFQVAKNAFTFSSDEDDESNDDVLSPPKKRRAL